MVLGFRVFALLHKMPRSSSNSLLLVLSYYKEQEEIVTTFWIFTLCSNYSIYLQAISHLISKTVTNHLKAVNKLASCHTG